jgi:hypothetical protein
VRESASLLEGDQRVLVLEGLSTEAPHVVSGSTLVKIARCPVRRSVSKPSSESRARHQDAGSAWLPSQEREELGQVTALERAFRSPVLAARSVLLQFGFRSGQGQASMVS